MAAHKARLRGDLDFIRINTYNTYMNKKLTISIDEKVYEGLHSVIGRGNISSFIERLARPYVIKADLKKAYKRMADDRSREAEAEAWLEAFVEETLDETR